MDQVECETLVVEGRPTTNKQINSNLEEEYMPDSLVQVEGETAENSKMIFQENAAAVIKSESNALIMNEEMKKIVVQRLEQEKTKLTQKMKELEKDIENSKGQFNTVNANIMISKQNSIALKEDIKAKEELLTQLKNYLCKLTKESEELKDTYLNVTQKSMEYDNKLRVSVEERNEILELKNRLKEETFSFNGKKNYLKEIKEEYFATQNKLELMTKTVIYSKNKIVLKTKGLDQLREENEQLIYNTSLRLKKNLLESEVREITSKNQIKREKVDEQTERNGSCAALIQKKEDTLENLEADLYYKKMLLETAKENLAKTGVKKSEVLSCLNEQHNALEEQLNCLSIESKNKQRRLEILKNICLEAEKEKSETNIKKAQVTNNIEMLMSQTNYLKQNLNEVRAAQAEILTKQEANNKKDVIEKLKAEKEYAEAEQKYVFQKYKVLKKQKENFQISVKNKQYELNVLIKANRDKAERLGKKVEQTEPEKTHNTTNEKPKGILKRMSSRTASTKMVQFENTEESVEPSSKKSKTDELFDSLKASTDVNNIETTDSLK